MPSATEFSFNIVHADDAQATGLSGTAVLASNNNLPIYAHPNTNWKWTGICEGPNAIYIAGYAGDSSTVYRLALDTTGAIPLLTKALTAADMPKGEQIYALGSYVGKYMVFGTSKGIRVGTIDTSGFVSSGFITYGPLTVVTNGYDPASGTNLNGSPCKAITFNDRYAYCTVTNYIDNGDGTFKILDRSSVAEALRQSMFAQQLSINAIDSITLNEQGQFSIPFEASTNYTQIKNILYSIVNKKIGRAHV